MRRELIRNLKCLECETSHEFNNQPGLIKHIKKEHPEMTYEEYVIKHFFDGIHPECKCGCGTLMKFESFNENFFNDYCKNHWPHKKHTQETKDLIKVNSKKGMIEKHGVDNPMKLQKFIDKIGDTKEKNHGDRNYNNIPKQTQTFIDRYGNPKFRNTEKQKETNFNLYGVRMQLHTPEGQLKAKQTRFEHFGDENYINVELIKQRKLEKYGYECEFQDPEWRKKHNGKTSKIEITVCEKLQAEPKFYFMNKEYDMKLGNHIIEVDGDYGHPNRLINMNLKYQLGNSINDYIKTNNLIGTEFDLIRISVDVLHKNKEELTLDFILQNRYYQDFSIEFGQVIISKEEIEYFSKFDEGNSLKRRVHTMFRFLAVFEPEYLQFIPNEILSNWRNKTSIKDSISKCFGLPGNDPIDISIKNLIENLEVSK